MIAGSLLVCFVCHHIFDDKTGELAKGLETQLISEAESRSHVCSSCREREREEERKLWDVHNL